MNKLLQQIQGHLPYRPIPLPAERRWIRPAVYIAVAVLLGFLVVRFQVSTLKADRLRTENPQVRETKTHKGAIGRWRPAVHQFWAQGDIYSPLSEPPPPFGPRPPNMHPNMPFAVMVLTPFAYLPVGWMALSFNLVKVLAIAGIVLGCVRLANHRDDRMAEWVALLGFLAGVNFLIGDLQHGNTNILVAAALVGHLWLFRKGHDLSAGALLALAICLKLMPALFLLYWAYQRQWRVLAGAGVAMPLMVLAPALFVDWSFFSQALGTWWWQIVYPGLSGQAWYPEHINQSLPAMIARLFTSGPSGNFLGGETDGQAIVTSAGGWITLIDLGEGNARLLLKALQAGIVLTAAWAIGWRVLPRDDGRRMLHYGMVCAMILLLNQRAWDHHATYLIVAHMGIVYAAAYARLAHATRHRIAMALLASVTLLWLQSGDLLKFLFGEDGANRAAAYGTSFWHFLVVWILCVILSIKLKRHEEPYQPDARDRAAPAMTAPALA